MAGIQLATSIIGADLSSATGSTNLCVTITAGNTGIEPGTANASGSTTSEFRVAVEKGDGPPRSRIRATPKPMNGAMTTKAI
ncbi:hypothetical protein [Paracoccus sp. Z118]|uniref:hypothetical protein n=1 Tax=Paracoccus sp. Z118 TaxID=2851017 RepID=UPI001C2B7FF7|nr:hypothetical protein [Paracoccus sp. Z118]